MFRVAPYIGVLELDLVFNMLVDLRFRHQAVWREAHGQDPCSSLKKSVAYHNWFALPERPVSDARAPFVLPEYLKMVLSKSIMRNVARFRIQGHGLKCDSGLYPACVCIL